MNDKPRKWWAAGLLSLWIPGLGQIYNGQMLKGLLIIVLPFLWLLGIILAFSSKYVVLFMCALILLSLIYYILVVTDAIVTARKLKGVYQLKKYNRVVVYFTIAILAILAGLAFRESIKNNYLQAYKIPAASMAPALMVGDCILVDKSLSARNPNRGDIIVFEYPVDPGKEFVKRVLAAGGDTVEIRDKCLLVNGIPVTEIYAIHSDKRIFSSSISPRDNYGPATLPSGSYFLLGDNRDQSYDSRFWGFVQQSRIKGTVKTIYWSWDGDHSVVRWRRIGMPVR